MVDARHEAVGVEERPFSRDFSKCLEERWSQKWGGAKGGAPNYIRRTATSLVRVFFSHALGLVCASPPAGFSSFGRLVCAGPPLGSWSRSCALLLWFSSSCGSAPPVVRLLLWFSWSCGSCAHGPVSDLFVGDADWRRSSAGCVARPSVSVRRAPERARRPSRHLEGAGNLLRSRGPIRSAKAHVIKVHGPCLPPCL